VRNCERSTAPAACSELYEPLLACYEATPATGFECSGQGFQQIARPDESVCQGQRDALIECAYPEVKACLDLCRAFDALYGGDAGSEPGSDTDAGLGVICPSRDIPCDSICWIVQGQSAEGIEPDDELDAGSSITLDAGSDINTLADELFVCAIDKAEACRSGAAQPAPDGGQPVMSANWASVLFDCADELGF
jgi:hypothetical protein